MHDEGAAGPQLVAVCVCACMYVQTYATLRLYGWTPHFFSKHANSYSGTSTTTEEISILKWLAARLRKGFQFRSCALWEDTSCPGLIHESALQSRPLLAAVSAFKVVPLNHRNQRTRRLLPSRTPTCEALGGPLRRHCRQGGAQGYGSVSARMAPGWQARWSSRVYSYGLV